VQGYGFNDLLSPYVQTQLWIHGYDPYSAKPLLEHWPSSAGPFPFPIDEVENGSMVRNHGIPTAYPPTCFLLMAPLALLPWPLVGIASAAISTGLFALMICALISVGKLKGDKYRLYAFLIFAFSLAPFHTGIAIENLGIVATELGVIAIWTTRKGKDSATALLLAIAICLKPQIGLCFFVFYLLQQRWRIVWVTFLTVSTVAFVAVARMQIRSVPWLSSYAVVNKTLFVTGVLSNFSPENPTRFGLINLQVALYPLLGRFQANAWAIAITGCFALFILLYAMRSYRGENELLQLSAIAVISLLPVYHRFYDASLLILPVCYLIGGRCVKRVPTIVGLALILPFFVPGGSMLEVLQDSGRISSVVIGTWWWRSIVMPHQIWCLLVLSILLSYCLANDRGATQPAKRVTDVASFT
jgi:hypothetical protein